MWWGLLLAALGTAVQNKERESAAERSRIERQTGREKEKAIEETQRTEVLANAAEMDPVLRQEAIDSQAAETEAQINAVLGDNELITTGDVGVISEPLLAQRAKSTREKANTASILAALNARVLAPGKAMNKEDRKGLELIKESQGRTSKLGRNRRTTDILASLMGTENASRMATGGLMQSFGMNQASGSIMGELQPPGGAGAPEYSGTPQYSPNPYYVEPDAFGVAGIR